MRDRDRRTPDGEAKRKLRSARNRKAARSRRKQIIASLKDRPCADCGQRFPSVCMDFDHRDRSTKIAQVGKMVFRSNRQLFLEIAKCDVVCANCHRLRTHNNKEHERLPEPRNDNQLGLPIGKAAP